MYQIDITEIVGKNKGHVDTLYCDSLEELINIVTGIDTGLSELKVKSITSEEYQAAMSEKKSDEKVEDVVDYEIDNYDPICNDNCSDDNKCILKDSSYDNCEVSYKLDDYNPELDESFLEKASEIASKAVEAAKNAWERESERIEAEGREVDWFQIYQKDVDAYLERIHKRTLIGLHPWDVIADIRNESIEDAIEFYNKWQMRKYGDVLTHNVEK